MELPVLITLEEDKFDSIYAFLSNPTVMFAVVLAVAAVTLFILWLISRRESRKKASIQEQFKIIVKEEAPVESPEVKRLKERESRIRDMESSMKSRKLSDLESREKMLLERQITDGVAQPRGEPVRKAPQKQPIDYAAIEPKGTPQEYERYVGEAAPPAAKDSKPEFERERNKLRKMIDIASEKYKRGEMDKETFMRIETDYYKKLIDLEVEMRGEGDSGG